MTTYELIAISSITMLLVMTILIVFGVRRRIVIGVFLNSISATTIYAFLCLFGIIKGSRLYSLMVGLLGNIFLISMPFF